MLIELQQKREGMAKRLRWYKEELERVQGWIDTEEYAIKAIDAEIANAKKVDQIVLSRTSPLAVIAAKAMANSSNKLEGTNE